MKPKTEIEPAPPMGYTTAQVARMLIISDSTVRRLGRRGVLEMKKTGIGWRITEKSVRKLLQGSSAE